VRRVAFVTYDAIPDLTPDDQLAVAALAALDIRTDAVRWSDSVIDWLQYDAVILRSTWDYFHHVAAFRAWIDRLESIGAKLWNRPIILRGNIDKRYLTDIRHPHLAPPPSAFFVKGSRVDLAAVLQARGWTEAVVKPTVSADGFSIERVSLATADDDQHALDEMVAHADVMIQKLVPEIRTNGEISLMFFNGEYSHAVGKRAAGGEFRVQERLGGVITPTVAPVRLVRLAGDLLQRAAPGTLYARVDVVVTADRFVLMELELLEPSLYLAFAPGAAAAFASAVSLRACDPSER
jgi:glutathione synthase/RimK-type ligase-like ATP-grasp enzyme